MKICIICTTGFGADGISSFVMNTYRNFNHDHIKCSIVFPRFIGNEDYGKQLLQELAPEDTYKLIDKYSSTRDYIKSLYSFLKKEKFDIVHIHGSSCVIALEILISKFAGVKNIITHSHNTTGNHILMHKLLKPVVKLFSGTHLGCGVAANKWMYGNSQSTVIPNGIELSRYIFDSQVRKRIRYDLNIDDDTFVIGHVGGFNEQKNHRFLINVISTIFEKDDSKVCLLLVGSGALMDEIKEKVSKLGITDNVKFLGQRKDVPQLMMAMDAFFLPSLFEGFPIVAVEAQSTGLPIVMSDTIFEETMLTDLISCAPIDKGVDDWINKYKSFKNYSVPNRVEYNEIVERKGYSIFNTANILMDIYKSLMD